MPQDILTVNLGSSSLKFALFEISNAGRLTPHMRGKVDDILTLPELSIKDEQGQIVQHECWRAEDSGHEPAFEKLLGWLRGHRGSGHLAAVGHRVVHGGVAFTAPVVLDDGVVTALEDYVPLAPLHQPHNLIAIRVLRAMAPDLLQVACFDTAFHNTIPKLATRFALPHEYEAQGVRRFGFHGLSYEYIVRELRRNAPDFASRRLIVAHLGSGASLCALKNGQSIDSSTGMTALDGLPMSTRCGAIDPGVLLYLMRAGHFTVDDLEQLLYRQSGLLGLSGISGSMRDLLASDDARAGEAVDYFVFRVVREIAALTASLDGLDGLVFTGGIGERAAPVRARICQRLEWLGVRLDKAANACNATVVSVPESPVSVRVIPTDEESMIALHTAELLCRSEQADLSLECSLA